MNEIKKKEDYVKILNRLFWGLLLMFINLSFSITILNVSYSIAFTYFAGAILILTTLWKYMNSSKTIKIFCFVLLGCLALGVLSFFSPLFTSNATLASLENIKQIVLQETATPEDLNALVYEILNLKSASLLSSVLFLATSALPLGTTIYFSGLLVKEIADSYKLSLGTKAKGDSILSVVFLALSGILSFVVVLSLFNVIDKVRFDSQGVVLKPDFSGAVASLSLSALVVIPVSIAYLVFIIKLLSDINKVKMSVSLTKEDDNVIDVDSSYTYSDDSNSNKNDEKE
ncbi:MAG: hypothetical protein SOW55_06355 [Bacilli bacterium]|nr:hypothetical protein [Bacillales bacterium]MDY2575569.1 hypothetical protein [Bacilli bacterium]